MTNFATAIGGLVAPRTTSGAYMESQSVLQRGKPQIYCRYTPPADGIRELAFIVFHPTSNFHGHYLNEPLVKLGAGVLALNTRHIGNDSMLIMERDARDVGAGMCFLRVEGYRKIVMLGNSGGGSLASFYQEQAEQAAVKTTPDGRPFDIAQESLPPADALALIAAHPGRASLLLAKIDGSVLDKSEKPAIDPALDMFNPEHGPVYSPEWLAVYRAAQARRMDRITDWVEGRLRHLDMNRHADVADDAFIIRRTQADPINLDLLLEPNDRKVGSLGGDARNYNEAPNGLGRFCTLRSIHDSVERAPYTGRGAHLPRQHQSTGLAGGLHRRPDGLSQSRSEVAGRSQGSHHDPRHCRRSPLPAQHA